MKFSTILLTETVVEKLTHLEHAEDHPINDDYAGARHAIETLNSVHEKLKGTSNNVQITTKYDGSPSLVFGRHPENGKFFVATKSAFNVNPKLNYSEKDIEDNHESEGLRSKLKTALKELPKVAPPNGVYQGDVMYTKEDVQHDGKLLRFKPNTITYSAHQDSQHGKKTGKAKLGLVVHTKYDGDTFKDMKAGFDVDRKNFGEHPNVHIINPNIDSSKIHHSPENKKAFEKHITAATELAGSMNYEHHRNHADLLKMHINSQVAKGDKPSTASYQRWLKERHQKDRDKLKTEAGKSKVDDKYQNYYNDISKRKQDFDNTFTLHHHLQQAKNALVHSLSSHTEFAHHVGDDAVKPEGFVAIKDNKPTKLVDREEFSRLNFLVSANRKKASETPAEPENNK